MGDDIEERIRPIVERVAGELATEIVAIAREVVRSRMLAVIDGETPVATKPTRSPRPKLAAPRGVVGRASLIAKAAAKSVGSGPACGKCGKPGHNARSCGRTPKGRPHGKRAKAADDEDEHLLPARDSVEHHHAGNNGATPLPSATRPHEPALSIPDDPAPASLAVVTAIAEATLSNPLDKREVCPLHGWVGRAAFQRDQHSLCERPVEAELVAPAIDSESQRPTMGVLVTFHSEDGQRHTVRSSETERSRSIAPKRISKAMLAAGAADLTEDDLEAVDNERPRTRADCKDGPRPCPWVSCRHHLFLDVSPETGSIKMNFPDRELEDMAETCTLDIAERGEQILETIGELMNITRERTRQIEVSSLLKLKAVANG